jgi:hypothetical protein
VQVEVYFGGSYQNDALALFVDEKQIYSKTLTTPAGELGITDSISFECSERQVELRIVVLNRESKSTVDLKRGRFLCIMHADGRPYLQQSQEPYFQN